MSIKKKVKLILSEIKYNSLLFIDSSHELKKTESKTIVVESFWSHPAADYIRYLVSSAIMCNDGSKNICLLQERRISKKNIFFNHVDYDYISRGYDVNLLIDLLFISVKNIKLIWKVGLINFCGHDLYDSIYDEFLRKIQLPTHKGYGVTFYLFSISRMLRAFAIKKVLLSYDISDVYMSHIVYSNYTPMLFAAKNQNIKTNIWTPRALDPLMLSKVEIFSSRAIAFKLDKYFIDLLHKSLKPIQIENLYQDALKNLSGKDLLIINKIKNTTFSIPPSFLEGRKVVTIYSHAFVDGVKCPINQVFKDNYTWLDETISILARLPKHDYTILVKDHPSAHLYDCNIGVKDLVQKYFAKGCENLFYVPSTVSSAEVLSVSNVVVSSHGSIGIEAPALGIPVIVCSRFEYTNDVTNIYCSTYEHYVTVLKNLDTIKSLDQYAVDHAKLIFSYYNYLLKIKLGITDDISLWRPDKLEEEYNKLLKFSNLNTIHFVAELLSKSDLSNFNSIFNDYAYKSFSTVFSN